jgi:hypothetical protein
MKKENEIKIIEMLGLANFAAFLIILIGGMAMLPNPEGCFCIIAGLCGATVGGMYVPTNYLQGLVG